jgi:adenosine deaminase
MMIAIGRRNGVVLPFADVAAARRAYAFENLQSFLEIYYRATSVLCREEDFYALTSAYIDRAASQNVRHAEIFFDPQAHTARGVSFDTVVRGISRALADGAQRRGITSRLIMCVLRDLSVREALEMLDRALEFRHVITGIGLDSAEVGNPPARFAELFERAHRAGFRTVAHAGEEGPADYIWQALDRLHVSRIDHGVRCLEDDALVAELVRRDIPLTVCPLSNVRLRVFAAMREHPLKRMLDRGLRVTVNSDDPAYFGGYVNENYLAATEALGLSRGDIVTLARNSFVAAFLSPAERRHYLDEVDAFLALHPD